MISTWRGSIAVDSGQDLTGIVLTGQAESKSCLAHDCTLHVVSVVEVARIPLHLAIGPAYEVTTSSPESESWLSGILLTAYHGQVGGAAWWETARTDSPLGILVTIISNLQEPGSGTAATELLVYAARKSQTEALRIHALPLCSALLTHTALDEPTPPPSLNGVDEEIEPTFLPPLAPHPLPKDDIINLPPVRKRKTVADQFDEAAERRHQARRKGGAGVAAMTAARIASNEALPTLKHRRSASNSQTSLLTRSTSRASSVSSVRPPTAREASVPTRPMRSSLTRARSVAERPVADEKTSMEARNKEIVSKVVLAGMRLYGIVPSKTHKSRSNSTVASPAPDANFAEQDIERRNEGEYKLMYHQIYKGTCFAFRQHIALKSLALYTEALRETVDKLLGIHCSDPLLGGRVGLDAEYTLGGRKAFGSAAAPISGNPFLVAPLSAGESKVNTPCDRKTAASDSATLHRV